MPVYEYHCTSCGKDFEYEHRMSDPRKTVCEACGGELERLISRTSFAFKGGGWYKDLYASPKTTPAGGDGAAASGASSSGGSSGSSETGSSSSATPSDASSSGSSSSGSGSGTAAAAAS